MRPPPPWCRTLRSRAATPAHAAVRSGLPNVLSSGGNVELASSWVDQLYTLIRISLQILGTDESAVANAFAWLDSDAGQSTSEAPLVVTLTPKAA